jgi:hypothetical protein
MAKPGMASLAQPVLALHSELVLAQRIEMESAQA